MSLTYVTLVYWLLSCISWLVYFKFAHIAGTLVTGHVMVCISSVLSVHPDAIRRQTSGQADTVGADSGGSIGVTPHPNTIASYKSYHPIVRDAFC